MLNILQLCLDHYNYDAASVINAVLEGTLPPKLQKLKDSGASVNNALPSYMVDIFRSLYKDKL